VGCSKKTGLPKRVDEVLRRNGIENYTVEDTENEFVEILLRDDFTSFDIINEDGDVYFITYDDDLNNIILLSPENKMIEGFLDNSIIPIEHFNEYKTNNTW
jgi:hypothetical protein